MTKAIHLPKTAGEGKLHKFIAQGGLEKTEEPIPKKEELSNVSVKSWDDFLELLESLEEGTRILLFFGNTPFLQVLLIPHRSTHDKRIKSISALPKLQH